MEAHEKIERLLRQFYASQPQLRAFVFASTRNYHATEEILQDVAIVVAQKAAGFDEERPLHPWLLGIARNKILKWREAQGREAATLRFDTIAECLPHARLFEPQGISRRQQALNLCLGKLPARQRRIVELRYGQGMDCSRIAGDLHHSVQSIYALLKRLKNALRHCVEEQLEHQEVL